MWTAADARDLAVGVCRRVAQTRGNEAVEMDYAAEVAIRRYADLSSQTYVEAVLELRPEFEQ